MAAEFGDTCPYTGFIPCIPLGSICDIGRRLNGLETVYQYWVKKISPNNLTDPGRLSYILSRMEGYAKSVGFAIEKSGFGDKRALELKRELDGLQKDYLKRIGYLGPCGTAPVIEMVPLSGEIEEIDLRGVPVEIDLTGLDPYENN
jgi:hypothetical protein